MANESTAVTYNRIIAELVKSPHGKLEEYVPIAKRASSENPEFLARLISWNFANGQIRDSKVALPAISIGSAGYPADLQENSLAAMGSLDPRNFLRSVLFYRTVAGGGGGGCGRKVLALVERYLRAREQKWGWWERSAVQHRKSMHALYSRFHVKPSYMANQILFKGEPPAGSVFDAIRQLKDMAPREAAGTIMERRIPFLIAMGALGAKAKEQDLVLALIERMSPAELTTNSAMLEKLGVKTVPALAAAYRNALSNKVAKAGGHSVLKVSKAVEEVQDEQLKEQLRAAQNKNLESQKGIEGNWLVLGDKSGSMHSAIEASRQIAGTLAKMVRGKVLLVFFDTNPIVVDVTGLDYDKILEKTKRIMAAGGTSIGCGLLGAVGANFDIDGIAIVSDGAENTAPFFVDHYRALERSTGKQPPVYLYRVPGEQGGSGDIANRMKVAGLDIQEFDLTRGKVDYYGLPGVVSTMRVNRYSLYNEVMDTPFLTLDKVLPFTVTAAGVSGGN